MSLASIPVEFVLFGLTLLGVVLFHHHTLGVALMGCSAIVVYKVFATQGFDLTSHLYHESSILLNLLGLLVGFELLADHFQRSKIPDLLPKWLPDDWKGGFVLLCLTFVLSSFLDNIAAAMIGGAVAKTVYQKQVHVGYLAAIVAASNAGGAGSVVGDTTTTMMWIDGVSPADVFHAYIASGFALVIFGIPASIIQDKHQRILRDPTRSVEVDSARLGIVGAILAGAILANVTIDFPAAGVWAAIMLTTPIRTPSWNKVPHAMGSAAFLLALVLAASMMPVSQLPTASWNTSFGLGFISAIFDNIPLTKLALAQGGYDWGHLAWHVGFGGSMIWFGSSAGVAITNDFPEGRNALRWLRQGWFIPVAYVIASFAMYFLLGWHPHALHK